MKKFLALLRAGLKSNFGFSVLRYRVVRQKKDLWMIPLVGLAMVSLVPVLYYYFGFLKSIHGLLKPLGQQAALLTLGLLTGQLLILVFGLFYVISAFYFSKDLEVLIPLPVRPFQVMLSKFVVILANEYLTVSLIVLPVLISFGVLGGRGLGYWIEAALVYLFLPVIPLALVSVLVLVLMRFVNLGRRKDALIIVGSLLLIILTMSLQFWVNRSSRLEPDSTALVAFFSSPDSLLQKVGSSFPPSVWATKALAGGLSAAGVAHLFLYAGASLLLLIGMAAGAEALFYRGLVGLAETSARGRALTGAEIFRRTSSGRRPVRALFQREWRLMNRTPIFLLNGTLTVIIIPVMILVLAKAGSRDSDLTSLFLMLSSRNALLSILVAAGFMILCGSLNGTASSALSREGSQFWISKVIPVSPRIQVAAKFLHSYLIAGLGIAAASAVLIGQIKIRLLNVVPALGLALATTFIFTAAGLAIDLARPLLDWINPQKAIKQNLNVLIAFLVDLGFLALLGFVCRLLSRVGVTAGAILAVLGLVLAGLAAASWYLLGRFAENRYPAIES
jgi:ABC-2 type transport system permease protein